MESELISIIVPVRNGAKTLGSCLSALLVQDYYPIEIIVVDNNSNDRTKQIIEEYASDGRIRYVFEGIISRGAARNAGISAARGSIICMIDADCIPNPDWARLITQPIRETNEAVVIGLVHNIARGFWAKQFHAADVAYFTRNQRGDHINHFNAANFAIKTELARAVMFDPDIVAFEDYDFYLRLKSRALIRYLPEVQVNDYFDDTIGKIAAKNFDRGYWLAIIYKKNRRLIIPGEDAMLASISLSNFIKWPAWLLLQIFIKTPAQFAFIAVAESFWRLGIIWGMMRTPKLKG